MASSRLLQSPDSLCARVLRALYFSNGDVLQAQPVKGMSYVWRSVLQGIQLLKEGLIWRIGDGTRIKVWKDPWIPRGTTRRPQILNGVQEITMVNDLIDPVTSQWNPELVQQVFSQEDAAVILSMPICRDAEDFMVWHYDSKGIFSVKSAYRVWLITQDLKSVRSSGASVAGSCWMKDTWKKLWQLHCPAKVHHFLWRFGQIGRASCRERVCQYV